MVVGHLVKAEMSDDDQTLSLYVVCVPGPRWCQCQRPGIISSLHTLLCCCQMMPFCDLCVLFLCVRVCVHLSSVVLQLLPDVQTVPGTPVSRPWSPLRRVGPAPAPTSPQPPNHTTATVSQYLPPLAGHCQYYEYVSSCSLCHYISPAFLTPKC